MEQKPEHTGPYRLGDPLPPGVKITKCTAHGLPKPAKAKRRIKRKLELPADSDPETTQDARHKQRLEEIGKEVW